MTARPDRRSFVWNAVALSAAQVGSPALNAALVVILARWAGPEALGGYSLLVASFLVVDQLRLLGLQRFVTREIASARAEPAQLFRGFVGLTDLTGLAGFVVLTAYGFAANVPATAVLAFAVTLAPSARVWANDAVFLALGRADYTTRVVLVESTVRAGASLAVLWLRGPDLTALGLAYAGARLVAALLGGHYRRRLAGPIAAGYDRTAASALLAHAPSFFAVTALPLLLLRADLLVVGATASAADVGYYGGATRLVALFLLVPDGVMLANFARLSRMGEPGAVRHAALVTSGAAVLLLAPAAAVLALFAGPITELVYGPAFAPGAPYLALLVWGVPLFIVCRTCGDALIASGHQGRLARAIIGTTLASIPVYLLLIPWLGTPGASLAYLGSLVILLVASAAAARSHLARQGARTVCLDASAAEMPVEAR